MNNVIIPSYRSDSIVNQPISIDGNIGSVRCGKLITQNFNTSSIGASPLIRAKSSSGSWVWSQTRPTSFITNRNEVFSGTGVVFVESKYSLVKYGMKAYYGMYTKNPKQ